MAKDNDKSEAATPAAIKTYPICSVCGNFQGETDADLKEHLKKVHGIDKSKAAIDVKEGMHTVQVRTVELDNREKELIAREEAVVAKEEDLVKREKALLDGKGK